MPPRKQGILLILGIIGLAAIVILLILPEALPEIGEESPHVLTRLFALYGFLFLSVATLTTPFLKEVTQFFGKPFLEIHHAFSVLGLVFITLHPISNSLQQASLLVFVPSVESWLSFWTLAGRPALFIIYASVLAAILRMKALRYWRSFHALMYIALFLGIVHANLYGEDFQNIGIAIIFNTLFAASMASFALKRFRNYQSKKT